MDGIDGPDYPSPYPVDQRGALLINSIDYRRFGTEPLEGIDGDAKRGYRADD